MRRFLVFWSTRLLVRLSDQQTSTATSLGKKLFIILDGLKARLFGSRSATPASVELISLHIPKTAGTSFRHFLKSIYGERAVIRLDIPLLSPILRMNEVKQPEGAALPAATKVVHGHFNLEELRSRFPSLRQTPAITWLRHPVERVVSNYYYLAKRLAEELDEEGKDLNILSKMQRTLLEYAQDEINRNRQTKFLAGTDLVDFDFVGIQEHYDAEVLAMTKHFGWPPQAAPKLNVTGKKRTIDPEVFDQIAVLNAADMALYERGVQLRRERMKLPSLELISVHIPKTGGTSFYKILSANYGQQLSPSLRRVDVQAAQKQYGGIIESLGQEVTVLHGHFYVGELVLSPGPSPRERGDVTVLRDAEDLDSTSEKDLNSTRVTDFWNVQPKHLKLMLDYAKQMRNNATESEKTLWSAIRNKQVNGVKFYRQKPMGYCIPDFVCLQKRLIVEVDGGYHLNKQVILKDQERDEKFAAAGYQTLRFSNAEVQEDLTTVVKKISAALQARSNRPFPFPEEFIQLSTELGDSNNILETAEGSGSAATPPTVVAPLSSGEGPGERTTSSPKVITFLRHPVDRIISNYHFFIAGLENPERNPANYALNKHRKGESLLEYAQRPENQNVMSKFLTGIDIDQLFFVGFLERFEDDIQTLGQLLDWSTVEVPKLNQGQQQPDVSEDIRTQLAELNAEDMALFKSAQQLRGLSITND